VFYNNLGGGIGIQVYADEALYNYGNRIYQNTFHNNRCFGILGGRGSTARSVRNIAINNLLSDNIDCQGNTAADVVNHDSSAHKTVANVIGKPRFVDADNRDFRLRPDSPAIDAGEFLTRTVGEGTNSALLTVEDSGYFFDGYDIAGMVGDEIQLAEGDATAVILSVDDSKRTLQLNRLLTWKHHQGVALRYGGRRPDAGAYEMH